MTPEDNDRVVELSQRIDATLRQWSGGKSVKADIVIMGLLASLAHAAWDSGCTTEAERNRAVPMMAETLREMLVIRAEL